MLKKSPQSPNLEQFAASARVNQRSLSIDTEGNVDMKRLRAYRLARVREQLIARDLTAAVLFDPINIRYATGSRNMAVWTLHNAARYAFVPTEGPVILFDYHNSQHLSAHLETIAEVRPTTTWYYFAAGPRLAEKAGLWAAEIAELVKQYGGDNQRIAMDHCDPLGAAALQSHGIELHEGQEVMEQARHIESAEEIDCMTVAVTVCEAAMAKMQDTLEAGVTENELWAVMNYVNHAMGGEWVETRLLTSGPRTNPWFKEAGERAVQPGELMSYDTDMIGPFGYCADISRTYFCGPGRPSDEQRRLYRLAWEQIHHNIDILKPGITYRELAEQAWQIPDGCWPNRYGSLYHGIGLCDEYPRVTHLKDFHKSFDGVIKPGETLCVESYIGEAGGHEGVKLEQQVLVTESGVALLSTYPWDDDLLPREV